jgi:1,4-dihydroxy-6-naphthoate synthase
MPNDPTLVRIAHSPDSDDAFMFYALTQGVLDTGGLRIEHVLRDIETLNQAAFAGTYEVTALSFHGYAHLADRYLLMPSGASFGDGYGPVVVAREALDRDALRGGRVLVPGQLTTAHLALRLWQPEVETVILRPVHVVQPQPRIDLRERDRAGPPARRPRGA